MSHRTAVSQLESDFADAMNRMYAVGNGLARLRSEIEREDAVASPAPVAAPPPAPRAPAVAPRASAPGRSPGPVTAPLAPAWSPPARPALRHRSACRLPQRCPGTATRAP